MTMKTGGEEQGAERKKNRFVIDDDAIEITGHSVPTAAEQEEADAVLGRILKDRKQG
jgi:hypothetical protein